MQLNIRKKAETAPTLADYLPDAGPRRQAFTKATERLADLMRQSTRLHERIGTVEAAQPELDIAARAAEATLGAVQARYARGLALDHEIATATTAKATAIAARDNNRDELATLRAAGRPLENEIQQARQALASARWDLLADAADTLQAELRADATTASKIALATAVCQAMRDPGLPVFAGEFDRDGFLSRTFPAADADQQAQLVAEVIAAVPLFSAA